MMQCISAPPDCHSCGHFQSVTLVAGPYRQTHHQCLHPTGAKPMHSPCAWHSDGAVMRVDGNRVTR